VVRAWIVALSMSIASMATAAPKKADLAKATRLVERAVDEFKAEHYIAAAELFLQAHDLSALPAPLRNAAKAFERGGDQKRALEAWRAYRMLPGLDATERGEADAEIARFEEHARSEEAVREAEGRRRAAELEAERARTATSTLTRTATLAPPSIVARSEDVVHEERHGAPLGGWLTLGAGGALLTTSLALFVHAAARTSDLDTKLGMTSGGLIVGIDYRSFQADLGSIDNERRWSGAFLGVGALIAVVGVAWLILGSE
jgi:hypothetical protein